MSGSETFVTWVSALRGRPKLALVAFVVGLDLALKLAGAWSPLPGGALAVERLVTSRRTLREAQDGPGSDHGGFRYPGSPHRATGR